MGFTLWLVYLGLVACCCSWTNISVLAKVDPPRARASCATNVIHNYVAQNGTSLSGKSWLQVQAEEFLVLELNYHCAKSSNSRQGATGPLFDVIQVETKSSQPIENICLRDERRNAHAVLTFSGLESYQISAVNTGSSSYICVLLEHEARIQSSNSVPRLALRDSYECYNDDDCEENQFCWHKRCECGAQLCKQWNASLVEYICTDCITPDSVSCIDDRDCDRFGHLTSECGPTSVCKCRKNYAFDNGLCVRDYATDYELAVKIALVAAIIIAVGILLAILYNTMRTRTLRSSTETPFTRQRNVRRSLDSLQRLVEGLLLDRPPPYSISNDKPPTYDEAVQDLPSHTDNNGNTISSNENNTTIAILPTPNATTPPPPYSMPYINPAFEAEETSDANPPGEDPFAILRIPPSRTPAATAPSTSVTFEMQADACSHL